MNTSIYKGTSNFFASFTVMTASFFFFLLYLETSDTSMRKNGSSDAGNVLQSNNSGFCPPYKVCTTIYNF